VTIPSIALSVVCALLIGALFHLVVDGGGARLLLYLALSTLGFAAGQITASSQGWSFLPIGPVQLGFAALGSIAFLLLGHWLSQIRVDAGANDGSV
jgi:hypothetical protein